ncbi:hypothetical protein TNCV_5088671 [Trichonephila clavipes]|nr:hypothetical protein TNCV_5088671 [Trichonephila clavipes]
MSRNVPDKAILVESSPGEKMELAFIPTTKHISTDLVAKESLCVCWYRWHEGSAVGRRIPSSSHVRYIVDHPHKRMPITGRNRENF